MRTRYLLGNYFFGHFKNIKAVLAIASAVLWLICKKCGSSFFNVFAHGHYDLNYYFFIRKLTKNVGQ